MLPVMTMKHYSKFVVNYLVQLLKMHKVTEATMMNKPVVDLQNFLTIQDSVFIVANQINKEYARYIFDCDQCINSVCMLYPQEPEGGVPQPPCHLCRRLQESRDVPGVAAPPLLAGDA